MICIAVVKIWKVESNLKKVVDYAEDKDKTDINNYEDLINTLDYAENKDKTEESLFIDGINCDPTNATKEMIQIKKKFMKTDGILAWHAYQSFKEGEVTPDEAHKIGLELANEMWGDRFQVVVTTHLNTTHLHNHFVLNSVSFIDGKKYNSDRTSYAEFRRLNDSICKEHGISYLKEKKTKSGINYLNYQNRGIKYTNYYKSAKEDLDLAIAISSSYDSFLSTLTNMGYMITNRAGKLSIRGKDYKRNIRIERYFGEDYSIENIKKQILGLYLPEKKSYYKNKYVTNQIIKTLLEPKYNSFKARYVRYCKLLNIYPYVIKKKYISLSMKEDIKKLDLLSEEAKLLVNNNIETEESFFSFLSSKEDEMIKLKNEREDLWKSSKKENCNKYEIKNKIDELNKEINNLQKEVNMCHDIRDRKDTINSNLESLKDKEMIDYEHIK